MKKQLLKIAFGLAILLTTGLSLADQVGPYYATPSWDQTLPNATRFVVLTNFNSKAALDRNTGLVWQIPENIIESRTPVSSFEGCYKAIIGNVSGWRLPSLDELLTLLDVNSTDGKRSFNPFFQAVTTPVEAGIISSTNSRSATDSVYILTQFIRTSNWTFDSSSSTRLIPTIQLCVRGSSTPN